MREISIPESGSKRKLLNAAEQLFAERGFEAVSLRDITQLAQANVAAVNYHFGSRENLVAMVMTRLIMPVNEERITRLDALERKWPSKVVPLEEIMDAMVRPLVTNNRKSELSERLFYKLTGQAFAQLGDGSSPRAEEQHGAVMRRFIQAFGKALPTVAADDLVWRIHFIIGGMIHMLTQQEGVARLTAESSETRSMMAVVSRFTRFAVAGMRDGLAAESPPEKGPQVLFDFS